MKILITGSRSWPNPEIVEEAILDLNNWYPIDWDDSVIVHGDCPTGADAQAESFARKCDIETEKHPADWDQFGKFAGPKRNQEMVDTKPDIVLAFLKPGSRGTAGTIKFSLDAGLPVVVYYRTINKDNPQWFDLNVLTYNGAKATDGVNPHSSYNSAPTVSMAQEVIVDPARSRDRI